jgi:hypothetical protein
MGVAQPGRRSRRWFAAAALAAALVSGCGTVTPSRAPSAAPVASASGNVSIDDLVAKVTASGINCSDAHHTGDDPGASDQVTCGGLEHTIDIETFGHASPDTLYLDGGTWAIYSTQNADVTTISKTAGVQPTRLCS